jgi:sortase A
LGLHPPWRSRAAIAALLLFLLLTLVACSGPPEPASAVHDRPENPPNAPDVSADAGKRGSPKERAVETLLPEDVLSEKQLKNKEAPHYEDWYEEGVDKSPDKPATSDSSMGAIPAAKPFNFGRDPGGPEDKTLYLSVPKLGLSDVPVFDSVSKGKLRESVVHVPATGFPWQKGANTYIAGHRIGYEGTGSYLIFYYLDQLAEGDEIMLRDSAGRDYRYRVTEQEVVGPDNVEAMDAVEGKSVVSLQTCTLPDYKQRLVVRGELVENNDLS